MLRGSGCSQYTQSVGWRSTWQYILHDWERVHLANHFIPNLPSARLIVLLVDSADTHADLQTFELEKANQVHMFALLKNATHLVQPAKVGVFGSMKQTWYKTVRQFSNKHTNTDITKKTFWSVFKSTWDEVMRPSTFPDRSPEFILFVETRSLMTK